MAKKRGEVWAVVGKFGFTPGLCAVRPRLLGVRRADRDVEGGVRVAKGRGEDVSGSEVSARNETGNLSLGSAVTGLSRNVHKCSDRVVAAGGLAHGATGGVGGACVQGSRLAGSTKHRFTGSGAAQEQSYRVNVLHRLQHSSVMRVEAPQPGVIDLCVAKFQQLRVSPPGVLVLVHLKQPLTDACVHASGDESLDGDVLRPHHHRQECCRERASLRERRVQILHGIPGPREYVVPEELPLGQSFIKLTQHELRCVRRAGGDMCVRAVRVSYSAMISWLAVQGAAHDAAGHEGGKRGRKRRAWAQPAAGDARGGLPPRVIRQVAAERGAHGRSHLPIKGSKQVLIEQIPVDARVVLELGNSFLLIMCFDAPESTTNSRSPGLFKVIGVDITFASPGI